MSNARNLSKLSVDSNGDVAVGSLPAAINVNASAPADSLAINASGQIGVGTTTTNGQVNIAKSGGNQLSLIDSSGSSPGIRFANSSNTALGFIEAPAGNGLSFFSGSTERMRIDSSGNVGIGGTVDNHGGYARCLQVTGTEAALELESSSGYSYVAQNGTSLQIRNVANGDMPFYTNNAERMRIDSSGNLMVGTTSAGAKFHLRYDGNATVGQVCDDTYASAGTNKAIQFKRNNSEVGTIGVTTTSTAYNTSSDYRLKENVAPMTGALATVAALKPCTYTWKIDGSAGQGFIAHELQAIVPDCVTGEKDAVEIYTDEEGVEQTRPVYQGVDTSFLVATLTAAIQELKAIADTQAQTIESLTARIEALEASNV